MKFSAKTEYACIAMMELAVGYESAQPVQIRKIAAVHGIPSRFLVQILLQLKGAGLVTSTRGAAGGYQLLQPPESITLGDVMSVIEGPAAPLTSSATEGSPLSTALLNCWQQLADYERTMLDSVTLADLIDRAAESQNAVMYYI